MKKRSKFSLHDLAQEAANGTLGERMNREPHGWIPKPKIIAPVMMPPDSSAGVITIDGEIKPEDLAEFREAWNKVVIGQVEPAS